MRRHTLQDGTGILASKPPVGTLIIYQTAAPTNGQTGFATGCIWINTSGTAGAILYLNQGTASSTTWLAIA